MSLIAVLIRVLFFAAIAWLAGRFLQALLRGERTGPSSGGGAAGSFTSEQSRAIDGERLVRDPVCGVALPLSRAIRRGEDYFCSEECARQQAPVV